jgi:hypothetical protein
MHVMLLGSIEVSRRSYHRRGQKANMLMHDVDDGIRS